MKRHEPEQLNMPDVSEDSEEYDLEDILREFGSSSEPPEPALSGDTLVFRPIRSEPPDPSPDTPTKTAEAPRRASAPKRAETSAPKPAKQAQEPVKQAQEPVKQAQEPVKQAQEPTKQAQEPVKQAQEPTKQAQETIKQAQQSASKSAAAPRKEPPASDHREDKPRVSRRAARRTSADEPPSPVKAAVPEAAPAPRVKNQRAVEKPPRRAPEPAIREVRPEPLPTPQEQLRLCRVGLSAQRMRLPLSGLVAAVQVFCLLYHALSWHFFPLLERNGGMLMLLLAVASLLLAYDVLLSGLTELRHLRINLFTLGSLIAVLTLVHAAKQLPDGSQSYCPVLSILLYFLLRALHAQRRGMFFTLRTVCAFEAPMGIFDAPNLLKGASPLRRDAADMDAFLRMLPTRDLPQKALCIYSPILLVLSCAAAYYFSRRSGTDFVQAWLLLLLAAVPFAGAMSYARPFAHLSRRLSGFGGALCGWCGARVFGGEHTVILRDGDLFPRGGISSNGMKLYGSYSADRVIGYALAVLEAADHPLADLFESQRLAQRGKRYRVSSFRFYDNDGIGAQVVEDVVLVGSLSFMRSMGVHMPEGTRVRQAVYVSINGELAGIFAIKYKPSASTRDGLRDLLANRNFSVVLATRDFLISPELIAAKYELPTDGMVFPAYTERIRLSEADPSGTSEQGALIAKDTFGAFASTVAAGHTLRAVSTLSLSLSLFSGIFGLLLCTLLLFWDSAAVAAPLHLAAFQLLWSTLTGLLSLLLLKRA